MENPIYALIVIIASIFILLEIAGYFLGAFRRKVWISRKNIEKEMIVVNAFHNKDSDPAHIIQFNDEQSDYFVASNKNYAVGEKIPVRIERKSYYLYKSIFGIFTRYESDEAGNRITRYVDRLISQ